MEKKVISFAKLPNQSGKRAAASSDEKPLYKFALMSYGDFRKDELKAVLTGKVVITENGMILPEKIEVLCAHRKAKDVENFDFAAAGMKSHDGWLVCEEKQIPVLTKYVKDFFADEHVVAADVKRFITILRNAEVFTKDAKIPSKLPVYVNALVPEAKVEEKK
jgi:hypothetical protein